MFAITRLGYAPRAVNFRVMRLVQSPVVFTAEPHGYTYGGKTLKGVTTILREQLFPAKYAGISAAVLAAAAERGTRVHEQCRALDVLGLTDGEEAAAYHDIKRRLGLTAVANEYTVSDNEHVASNIDLVAERNGEIVLADFKTTSSLDMEYLSWQLSIYKFLFEIQNPGLSVSSLLGIWLPAERYGRPKAVEIPAKSADEVRALLAADAAGTRYTAKALPVEIPADILALRERVTQAVLAAERAKREAEEVKGALLAAMETHHVKTWETDDFCVARTEPTTQERFDTAAYRKANPEEYMRYTKTTAVKGGIKITLKNK